MSVRQPLQLRTRARRSARRSAASGVNFSVFSKSATRDRAAAVRRRDAPRAGAGHPARRRARTAPITTGMRFVPGLAAGPGLRATARTGRSRRNAACGSTPRRCCSTRTASPSRCPTATTARPRSRPGDNAAVAMKSVVADPGRYDWEGDGRSAGPFAETVIYELHVRGFTRHPSSGVARREARHLRRADREDSLPQGPRASPPSSCCRCFSSIRRTRRRRRELLGLPAGLVLRAASRVQLAARTARRARRIPRHGQGAAPRRHRSHPRRRVQPHDRRRRRTGRRCAIAAWPTTSTTSSRTTSRGTPTTPAAATR